MPKPQGGPRPEALHPVLDVKIGDASDTEDEARGVTAKQRNPEAAPT